MSAQKTRTPAELKQVTKRSSKNRPRGTVETKPRNVDAAAYRSMVVGNVILAIMQKVPKARLCAGVFLQQDNAGPHRSVTTGSINSEVDVGEIKISVKNQQPNSLDFNVLD